MRAVSELKEDVDKQNEQFKDIDCDKRLKILEEKINQIFTHLNIKTQNININKLESILAITETNTESDDTVKQTDLDNKPTVEKSIVDKLQSTFTSSATSSKSDNIFINYLQNKKL
jgi:ribosomal protein L14E/L6E/L27E